MSSVDEEAVRRPRGRPRAFDREAVLRRAMELFWAKGFDHCSMNDLVEAMGINSPSIYAAFGSKEDLFREALALYGRSEGATAAGRVAGTGVRTRGVQDDAAAKCGVVRGAR